MNTEDKIKVMKHYAAGGRVKVNSIDGHESIRHIGDLGYAELVWNWTNNVYSIIKEPKSVWIIEYTAPYTNTNGKWVLSDDANEREAQLKLFRSRGYGIISVEEYKSK